MRRKFTAEYKRSILEEADAGRGEGAIGALLRREGLYSSHLSTWRRQRKEGTLQALSAKKRGHKSNFNPLARHVEDSAPGRPPCGPRDAPMLHKPTDPAAVMTAPLLRARREQADPSRQEGISPADFNPLTTLLQLEAQARRAQDLKTLQFFIVNETRRLLNYRQAILFIAHGPRSRLRAEAISSLAVLDRDAPMLRWAERTCAVLAERSVDVTPQRFHSASAPPELVQGWRDFSPPYLAMVSFHALRGGRFGSLWFAREEPWQDNELVLLQRLGETYAHAYSALSGQRRSGLPWPGGGLLPWALGLGMVALLAVPVRMSTLAPAELVAKEPTVVSAPMDGVIAALQVEPNQTVDAGTLLLGFDDTELRNDYEVAKKTLAVAVAEYHRSAQAAFADERDNAEVALLKAKAELAAAERDYAQEMLSRVEVKAAHGGVVQFRDKADWIGKPVQVGERIIEIADPSQVHLRVSLPVKDAIALSEGAEVRAFFDIDPLHPLTARVKRVAHRAELLPGDILAYRIDADLQTGDKAEQAIRIGARATAKLYGAWLPLAYHLFRRPLSAARQYFGL